jgi:hypothetical protein
MHVSFFAPDRDPGGRGDDGEWMMPDPADAETG